MIFLFSRQLMTQKTRGNSSVVEHHLAKVGVAGSNPVFRFVQKTKHLNTFIICRGGGIGRRTGLKILRGLTSYRFDPGPRHFILMHPWLNWIEYLTTNQAVAGSNPAGCMFIFFNNGK